VTARRILITGLSAQLGGRLAQALKPQAEVETIIGVDSEDPRHEFARTEFVRVAVERRPLRRIIRAAQIDTVLDTRLLDDALSAPIATIEAVNVAGTSELLGACTGPGSPVRTIIFKSSAAYYGCEPGDPAFLSEDMARSRPPRSELERSIVVAEDAVRDFAARNSHCRVAVMRLAQEIGSEEPSSLLALLSLPVIPGVLGFDPRLQVIHSEDVVGALTHAVSAELDGVYNVAGDGVLVLSEAASLLGKTLLPVLPPWGAGFAAAQLRRLGLRVPVELVRQLRHGRGLDNRRLKASGYRYHYTSREALIRLRARQRLRPLLGSGAEPYRYNPDLEEFLRWSPSVLTVGQRRDVGAGDPPGTGPSGTRAGASGGFDALGVGELVDLIPSLEPEALRALRRYESEHQQRAAVLEALERSLARRQEEPSA
jgi:UDP-glucose 4-epimerase